MFVYWFVREEWFIETYLVKYHYEKSSASCEKWGGKRGNTIDDDQWKRTHESVRRLHLLLLPLHKHIHTQETIFNINRLIESYRCTMLKYHVNVVHQLKFRSYPHQSLSPPSPPTAMRYTHLFWHQIPDLEPSFRPIGLAYRTHSRSTF